MLCAVCSLRVYWRLLDGLVFPHSPLLGLLLPGLVGAAGLLLLGLASCLHGGVTSHQPGQLWQSWVLTHWLAAAHQSSKAEQQPQSPQ